MTFMSSITRLLILHEESDVVHRVYRQQHQSAPHLYSLDLGTFRVALLRCYPQRFWHHAIVILLSVRAFDEFSDDALVTCKKAEEKSQMVLFCGLFGKYRIRQFQLYLQKGKRRSGRNSKPVSRQQMCHNWHYAVRDIWESGGLKWEMGQESE
jgi:hypothetical protein